MKLLTGRPEHKLLKAAPPLTVADRIHRLQAKMFQSLAVPASFLGDPNTNRATAETNHQIFKRLIEDL